MFQSLENCSLKSSKPWKFFAVLFPMLGSLAFAQGPGSLTGFFQAWFGYSTLSWTPENLDNKVYWFDASDADTISVVAGTNRVSEWRDKSGNERHLTQATSDRRPYYETSLSNSLNVVRFIGSGSTGEFLDNSSHTNSQPYSFVALIRMAAADTTQFAFSHINSSIVNVLFGRNNSANFDAGFGTLQALQAGNGNYNIWHLEANGSIGRWNVNGGIVSNSVNFGTANFAGIRLGNLYTLFGNYGLNGDICEFVMINGTLDNNNRQLLEGYMAHKWELTSQLPADHPYKNAPPTR
jgi:hypothetical protein